MADCKICEGKVSFLFKKTLITKYEVSFFKCNDCEFIQTDEPYWLEEAYTPALSPLDVTLASRQAYFSQLTENIVLNHFDSANNFLDYGGGSGLLVRMMRDKGYSFYRQDKYSENIFSQYFDILDLPSQARSFELLTCFEVLEHLPDPLKEFSEMFSFSGNIFCSTLLQPNLSVEELEKWDYFGELHGQHVSFYSAKTLQKIARRFDKNCYSDGVQFHLFTDLKISKFSVHKPHGNNLSHQIEKLLNNCTSKVLRTLFPSDKGQLKLHPLTEQDYKYVQSKFLAGKCDEARE